MNFNSFRKTGIFETDVIYALEYCRKNQVDCLEFDKGEYHFSGDLLAEGNYCISNHGSNGPKRAAFFLKDMENFTINGNGSEFICDDISLGFIIDNCENITLKNFKFDSKVRFTCSGKVSQTGDDYFVADFNISEPYFIRNGDLFFGAEKQKYAPAICMIECNSDSKKFRSDAADSWFETDSKVKFDEIEEGKFKVTGFERYVTQGNTVIVLSGYGSRQAPAIFAKDSANIKIENYTLYGCMGMGVIAQKCENITIDNMKTTCKDDRCYSASADATHFVSCRGLIHIKNCSFEAQLDDCFNVHGIYNKIIAKGDSSIIIKYVHPESKGIDIYQKGTVIEISDKDSLLPYFKCKVVDVKVLNNDCTVLYLDTGTENIRLYDVIEDVTRCPSVIFENNRVAFNRARGMLLASRGKTIIKNNYFNTPGCAILFESNGTFWYEGGFVKDVVIENNVFDNCCYTEWGNEVISVCKRAKQE